MKRLLAWPVRHSRAALICCGLLTLLFFLFILRLKPETSLAGLLDPNDPGMSAMSQVLNDFPVVNEALVMASLPQGMPADEAKLLTFAGRLKALTLSDDEARALVAPARFQPEAETRAFVEKVIVPNALFYLSMSQMQQLQRRLTREGMIEQLNRNAQLLSMPGPAAGGLAKSLAADPLGLRDFLLDRVAAVAAPGMSGAGPFFSPDRRSLLIRIGGLKSAGDFKYATRVTQTVQRLIEQSNSEALMIDVGGAFAMSAHSARRIELDSYADIISTVLGLMILFALACRRPLRLFTFAFIPVMAGIIWGFGAYAMLFSTITPLAAVVGGTLGAIGLDYTTHFLTHYQALRRNAADTPSAVLQTSQQLLLPSLAAWMTSVIGFAAVGVSPVRVLRDFAILGTLCLIGAWLSTLLILPAMLTRFSRTDISPFEGRFGGDRRIFDWLSSHARSIVGIAGAGLVVLVALTLVHGTQIQFESDPMILHPRPSPPLEAQHHIAERMQTTAGAIIVYLRADDAEQLVSLAHRVHDGLESAEVNAAGVSGSFGLEALLSDAAVARAQVASLPQNFGDSIETNFRAAIAQSDFQPGAFERYTAFLRQLAHPGDVPGVPALNAYPELYQLLLPRDVGETNPEAVTLVLTNRPLETRAARQAALDAVRGALAGVSGATVTGTIAIGHDLEFAIQRDLPRFIIIALVCIGVYLILHFRSLAMAAFALLPIGVSLVVVIACFCLAGVRLNLLHTVMVPLLLGINLDYGIFAVHAWREARDRNDMARHFTPAFSGLIICGGSTVIGFGSMVVTSIPAVKSLGWLINIGVISCVAATLLVQWPAMLLSHRRKLPSAPTL